MSSCVHCSWRRPRLVSVGTVWANAEVQFLGKKQSKRCGPPLNSSAWVATDLKHYAKKLVLLATEDTAGVLLLMHHQRQSQPFGHNRGDREARYIVLVLSGKSGLPQSSVSPIRGFSLAKAAFIPV